MVTKEGIVTCVLGAKAWVRTTRSKSCDSCEAKDSCEEYSKIEEMTIQVENSLDVSIGDKVLIGFKTAPLLKVTFMLYIFPILLLIIGAIVGESIAVWLNVDKSATSIVVGMLFFIISFIFIRVINNLWANNKEYQPFMMRFMQKVRSCSASS